MLLSFLWFVFLFFPSVCFYYYKFFHFSLSCLSKLHPNNTITQLMKKKTCNNKRKKYFCRCSWHCIYVISFYFFWIKIVNPFLCNMEYDMHLCLCSLIVSMLFIFSFHCKKSRIKLKYFYRKDVKTGNDIKSIERKSFFQCIFYVLHLLILMLLLISFFLKCREIENKIGCS